MKNENKAKYVIKIENDDMGELNNLKNSSKETLKRSLPSISADIILIEAMKKSKKKFLGGHNSKTDE